MSGEPTNAPEVPEVPERINFRANPKIDIGKALKMRMRRWTMPEIAKYFHCSVPAVSKALSKFRTIVPMEDEIREFRQLEADLLDSRRLRLEPLIVNHAEQGRTRKAYELAGIYSYSLRDARLLRGESTANIASLTAVVEAATQRIDKQFGTLQAESKPEPVRDSPVTYTEPPEEPAVVVSGDDEATPRGKTSEDVESGPS